MKNKTKKKTSFELELIEAQKQFVPQELEFRKDLLVNSKNSNMKTNRKKMLINSEDTLSLVI